MATLTLSGSSPATVTADALVLGVASAPDGPRLLPSGLPPAVVRRVTAALPALGVSGAPDEVVRLTTDGAVTAPVIVLTGVGATDGPRTAPQPEALRRAAGAAVRNLAGTRTVALGLPVPDPGRLAAVAEGALLGAYAFTGYRSTSNGGKPPVARLVLLTDTARSRASREIAQRAQLLAAAVHATRDLVNMPPSALYPQTFAERAVAAAEGLPITVTVLDERRLARGGYGGLLGVGLGSSRPPRLVRLDYTPAGAKGAAAVPYVALVGKGITFDTGGISLKPPAGMELMKSDMAGAAAVLSTVVAAAQLAVPVRVSGWLALAENMPSGTAQRPSDVITVRGGRTIEVLNTDAEGRLVLADALVDAVAAEPDLIVDVATLTGAQRIALGDRVSAIMANDDALRDRLHRLSEAAGEQFWPMPLPADLRKSLDSPVADIANMGEKFGGMLVAGVFLADFVGGLDGPIPWAHLDIAAPAFHGGGPYGYTAKGGTGVAVRTLLSLIEDVAANGPGPRRRAARTER